MGNNQKLKKTTQIIIFLAIFVLIAVSVISTDQYYNSQATFDLGTYAQTKYNTSSLIIDGTNTSGNWTGNTIAGISSIDNVSFSCEGYGELTGNESIRPILTIGGTPANLLWDGLWHFNNESNLTHAKDWSGSGWNGLLHNVVYNNSCLLGGCFEFDNAADEINITNTAAFDDWTTISLGAWVLTRGYGGNDIGRIFNKENNYEVMIDGVAPEPQWELEFRRFRATTSGIWTTKNDLWNTKIGKWTHFVIVYNGSALANDPIFYIDGVQVTIDENTVPNGALSTSTDPFIIGNRKAGGRGFDGWIDEAFVTQDLLSKSQVSEIYNRTRFGKVNNITLQYRTNGGAYHTVTTPSPFITSLPGANLNLKILLLTTNTSLPPEVYSFNASYTLSAGDSINPIVNLDSPTNGYEINTTNNVTLQVSATDNVDLDNCTTWHNISGTWANNGTKVYTGLSDTDNWTINSVANGTYIYNSYCCDNSSNCAWNATNYTFSVAWPLNSPNTAPAWTNNASKISNNETTSYFNITWTDDYGLSIIYFESNFSGTPTNYTMNNLGGGVYNYSGILPAGTHYWRSFANDTSNLINQTPKSTFTISYINYTYPLVSLISPANLQTYSATNNVAFTFNATGDFDLVNCSLYMNVSGGFVINDTVTLSGKTNSSSILVSSIPNGTYIWNVECYNNNSYSSFAASNRTFFMFYIPSTSSPATNTTSLSLSLSEDVEAFLLLIIVGIAAFLFLAIGLWVDQILFIVMSGLLFVVDGLILVMGYVDSISNLFTQGVGIIAILMGVFIFIAAWLQE